MEEQARKELADIETQIESAQLRRTKANERIKELRVEHARLARVVKAFQPRKSDSR
jgi:septal ring factor EnvC (AmiA/AmiB activator)